jgi:antitoxin ParD1/3/4
MRTNIDIDDATLEAAMRAGPFKTKKEAVEAGLKLLARQAAYHEILKWEGKLHWDGDDEAQRTSVLTTGDPGNNRPRTVNDAAVAPTPKPRHGRR